ncbi:hypothetical protein M404DRAFT_1003815 [Pisolithus tinctorius Marx 270]|uniref:Uncharacterized protein n=1 Tax=Pisolithus tinctorius Marx 270 TaxID=870435 RepID=A0A0C3NYL7_PISTI|nr:hypothetical protein M404DRAFT_1003815 [Pisolithus tinctorius Marx 270]
MSALRGWYVKGPPVQEMLKGEHSTAAPTDMENASPINRSEERSKINPRRCVERILANKRSERQGI